MGKGSAAPLCQFSTGVAGSTEVHSPAVANPSTFAEIVRMRAGDPNPALRFEDEMWTGEQFVAECAQRAALMNELRRPGPFHIGIHLDNVPEFLFWLGGAALVGAAIVGINPTRRGAELVRDIEHTDCQWVVSDTTGTDALDGLTPNRLLLVDSPDGLAHLARHINAPLPADEVTAEALLLLLFTSGTTGDPKAVRCTQGRLARIAVNVATQYGFTAADVTYQAMPLFHGNALMANWAPALYAGATVALRRKFSARGFSADIHRFGATYFNYVGKALTYILATPEAPDDAHNTLTRCFGNEASHRDIAEFQRRFGVTITEGYGSSEGGAVIAITPDTPPGALGLGREGVTILDPLTKHEKPRAQFDEHGRILNAETATGEIANLLGVPGFEGYYNNPEADRERVRDGIYWSGDLGYRDRLGFFWFAGRGADWLRVDGENFAAAPVERLLYRFPGVVTAAVYAVADPLSGDAVMATLELAEGHRFDPDAFAEFLSAQPDLGTKWAPRFVRLAPSMPLTGSMKVVKHSLRAESWGCNDPVYVRAERGPLAYELLTPITATTLAGVYRDHGRENLVPASLN